MAAEWEGKVEVAYQNERLVILRVGERYVASIYGDSKARRKRYRK